MSNRAFPTISFLYRVLKMLMMSWSNGCNCDVVFGGKNYISMDYRKWVMLWAMQLSRNNSIFRFSFEIFHQPLRAIFQSQQWSYAAYFRGSLLMTAKHSGFFDSPLAVCSGVRGKALASHTCVFPRFDSRDGDCLLLFADYKLRSIYNLFWFTRSTA